MLLETACTQRLPIALRLALQLLQLLLRYTLPLLLLWARSDPTTAVINLTEVLLLLWQACQAQL